MDLNVTSFFLVSAFGRGFALVTALVVIVTSQFFTNSAFAAESAFTDAQRTHLNKIIEQYIFDHPEVILKSIQSMQARQKAAKEAEAAAALKERKQDLEADPDDPIMGNPTGTITVVEFFDYRCGYCKRVFPTVMKAINDNPNVRYVVKEFPILGPESVTASRASLAVWRNQKESYSAFHAALIEVRGDIPEAKILNVAAKLGLNTIQLKKDMTDPEIDRILEKTYQLAKALNINGTPAFVIGGKLVPGAIDAATMNRMIAESIP